MQTHMLSCAAGTKHSTKRKIKKPIRKPVGLVHSQSEVVHEKGFNSVVRRICRGRFEQYKMNGSTKTIEITLKMKQNVASGVTNERTTTTRIKLIILEN